MDDLSKSALDFLHGNFIFKRRVHTLSRMLADCLPHNARVLDIGSGDGTVGMGVKELRPDITLQGIDIYVREKTAYPVTAYDGEHIPFDDGAFDVCMFVDVLHHTPDPIVLLSEAARVSRVGVILKDHLREGLLAEETLKVMDWIGNARHGVVLPYNYLNELQWKAAFVRAGLTVDTWQSDVGLYTPAVDFFFGRKLHFVARLGKNAANAATNAATNARTPGATP
jgi:SAM-dependent methyltransferase